MEIGNMLAALRQERDQITEAIMSVERLALGGRKAGATASMDGRRKTERPGKKTRSSAGFQKQIDRARKLIGGACRQTRKLPPLWDGGDAAALP
jgi:hypothetical protein